MVKLVTSLLAICGYTSATEAFPASMMKETDTDVQADPAPFGFDVAMLYREGSYTTDLFIGTPS
jgi:hypothetical protein